MAEIAKLRAELAVADRHVAECQGRIARQVELVRELENDGHDTKEAENLLQVTKEGLPAIEAHRQHIVRELSPCSGDRS